MVGIRNLTLALGIAGSGAFLFSISAIFLVLLLHHRALTGDYTDTYFLIPYWLLVTYLVCSVLVLVGYLKVRYNNKSQNYVPHRLAFAGILLTGAAWTVCGISWLIAGM